MRAPQLRLHISTLSELEAVQIKLNCIKIMNMLPLLESQTEALDLCCLLEEKIDTHKRNSKI